MKYTVWTQHEKGSPFIVPMPVEAEGPREAAEERLGMMSLSAQEGTIRILVLGAGRAWIFPIVTSPRVGDPL